MGNHGEILDDRPRVDGKFSEPPHVISTKRDGIHEIRGRRRPILICGGIRRIGVRRLGRVLAVGRRGVRVHRYIDSKNANEVLYVDSLQGLSLTNTLTEQERSRMVRQLLGRRQTMGRRRIVWVSGTGDGRTQVAEQPAPDAPLYGRQMPATYMKGQSNQGSRYLFHLPLSATMIFLRASFALAVVSVVALFCAQSVEAAKGPKITNKVYFDIKQGDENLGRSTWHLVSLAIRSMFRDV